MKRTTLTGIATAVALGASTALVPAGASAQQQQEQMRLMIVPGPVTPQGQQYMLLMAPADQQQQSAAQQQKWMERAKKESHETARHAGDRSRGGYSGNEVREAPAASMGHAKAEKARELFERGYAAGRTAGEEQRHRDEIASLLNDLRNDIENDNKRDALSVLDDVETALGHGERISQNAAAMRRALQETAQHLDADDSESARKSFDQAYRSWRMDDDDASIDTQISRASDYFLGASDPYDMGYRMGLYDAESRQNQDRQEKIRQALKDARQALGEGKQEQAMQALNQAEMASTTGAPLPPKKLTKALERVDKAFEEDDARAARKAVRRALDVLGEQQASRTDDGQATSDM